jgi:hypothetical protein
MVSVVIVVVMEKWQQWECGNSEEVVSVVMVAIYGKDGKM